MADEMGQREAEGEDSETVELWQAEQDEALAAVDRLAEQIARSWRSPKSGLDLLDEQRR